MKRKTSRTRIVRASAEEIARRIARGEDRTDWKRVKAMKQSDVERLADEEDGQLLKPINEQKSRTRLEKSFTTKSRNSS